MRAEPHIGIRGSADGSRRPSVQAFGTRMLLRPRVGMKVVADAPSAGPGISYCRRLKPDVVVLGVNLNGMDGVSAAREIRRKCPKVGIVIASEHDNVLPFREAMRGGVKACYHFRDESIHMEEAVRAAAKDEYYASPIAWKMICDDWVRLCRGGTQESPETAYLGTEELELLSMIREFPRDDALACAMGTSVKLARTRRLSLMAKMGATSRTSLLRRAQAQSLFLV